MGFAFSVWKALSAPHLETKSALACLFNLTHHFACVLSQKKKEDGIRNVLQGAFFSFGHPKLGWQVHVIEGMSFLKASYFLLLFVIWLLIFINKTLNSIAALKVTHTLPLQKSLPNKMPGSDLAHHDHVTSKSGHRGHRGDPIPYSQCLMGSSHWSLLTLTSGGKQTVGNVCAFEWRWRDNFSDRCKAQKRGVNGEGGGRRMGSQARGWKMRLRGEKALKPFSTAVLHTEVPKDTHIHTPTLTQTHTHILAHTQMWKHDSTISQSILQPSHRQQLYPNTGRLHRQSLSRDQSQLTD